MKLESLCLLKKLAGTVKLILYCFYQQEIIVEVQDIVCISLKHNSLGMMSSRPLKIVQHFRGTYHLHLQAQVLNQATNQHEAGSSMCYIPEERTQPSL
jgi:hypothetical protein